MTLPMKTYFVVAICMIIWDGIWLTLNKPMYSKMVLKVQNTPMKVKWVPAILAYILMYIGMIYFVIPKIIVNSDKSFLNVFKIAGTFGLVVYGIWNMTNMAIFDRFDYKVATLDTLWGVLIYSSIAYIAVKYTL